MLKTQAHLLQVEKPKSFIATATGFINRYITERPYLSTQIFSLKISRAKAELSSAYLKFSLALNWWDVKINNEKIYL